MATPLRETTRTKDERTKIATWNIQGGITCQYDAQILCQDFERYKIGIGALQETRCGELGYTSERGTKIICLESDKDTPKARQYGLGFVMTQEWSKHFWGIRRISDRICVAQFRLNKTGSKRIKMCVINVYGPTSIRQE